MRIVCFGDSNTYGYDPRGYLGDRYESQDRWVDILAQRTGWDVVNAGINGREIPRGCHALRLLPDLATADKLLVMLGTNDLLQGASAEETAEKMEAFLTPLLPHGKNLLLVCPPPMKRGAWVCSDALVLESIRLAEAYKQLADRLNVPYVDTRSWNIECAFDGVHFTETGHRTFANHLIEHL